MKILVILLLCCPYFILAQNAAIDSIKSIMGRTKGDTTEVNNLNALSSQYGKTGDYQEALKDAELAFQLSKKLHYKKGIASAYHNKGVTYNTQGDYKQGLKNHLIALRMRTEEGDKKGIASSYINIGISYLSLGNYPDALNKMLAALKIREEIGDKPGIGNAYVNIGKIYSDLGNINESLKSFQAALKIEIEIGDKFGTGICYNNIGNIYEDLDQWDEAMKNHQAALSIRKEIGDKHGIAVSYINIGQLFKEQGNYGAAMKKFFEALKINESIDHKKGIITACQSIGELKVKLNKTSEAKIYLDRALQLSTEIGNKELIKVSFNGISEMYESAGDYSSALKYYKSYTEMKDSLLNEDNNEQIAQMKESYESDKKDQQILLLNKDKTLQAQKALIQLKELQRQKFLRNGFLLGFAIMMLFAGVFFMQRNKIKKGKQRSDELLLNILPAEVAEELKNKGRSDARDYELATVMFTDFKDFTKISEQLAPAKLLEEINFCFSEFDKIIYQHGIEKIKTIGDAYMCAGGLPVKNVTHAEDTVKAAIKIRDFINDYNKGKIAKGLVPFEIRIGINTGPLVAGIVGVKKFAYDIWGDTVNIAARMEGSGQEGRINISGSTYEFVKDTFHCEHRGKIQAKNKGEIDMYFVENM